MAHVKSPFSFLFFVFFLINLQIYIRPIYNSDFDDVSFHLGMGYIQSKCQTISERHHNSHVSKIYSIFRDFCYIGATSFMLFCCFCLDIALKKWHMPFVHQQLMCAMEETFCKNRGVKFANINLVSNWTPMFQLNELPFKCSRPWLHTFNPEVNLIWSRRAVQRNNPLIDKANWRLYYSQ